MRDLSLHLLDLTQNSVTAGASLVEILLTLEENGWLTMVIRDDGRGMSPELLARVTSPFATTRTTRKVGAGYSHDAGKRRKDRRQAEHTQHGGGGDGAHRNP